jgi:DNA repair protein RecN (Recombination protein N)
MLRQLQLRDFVIVDRADLEFAPGMTALTGETGAGKSIIVDALGLLAGGRASADVVRQGAERAEASASFSDLPPAALRWLADQAIDHDGEVLVRRVVGTDGRSRAYLNGQMVPLQSLREFADLLLEIHGQQEFQHLVKRDAQRRLLDEHGQALDQAAAVADAHGELSKCLAQLEALRAAAGDRDARLDLLRYHLAEMRAEVGSGADIDALLVERQRIAGSGRLGEAARTALAAVEDAEDANAQLLLARAQTALRGASSTDPALAQAGQFLAEALIQVDEAAGVLRRFLETLDIDPQRQDEVERRAAALESLARKHRISVAGLPQQRANLEQELDALENSAVSLGKLEARLKVLRDAYDAAAAKLSAARAVAAQVLGTGITQLMQGLGMKGGRFQVQISSDPEQLSVSGIDTVDFLVSANPGQEPKSLAKVASGGELSRISLAIQVAAAARAGVQCMVFDEVDAGIGGAIAEIVGLQLRALGERGQVLCVTHLPQVASQAHAQYQVSKQTDGKVTRTSLRGLTGSDRIDEIARMLGGIDVTDKARAHAREMLKRGSAYLPRL